MQYGSMRDRFTLIHAVGHKDARLGGGAALVVIRLHAQARVAEMRRSCRVGQLRVFPLPKKGLLGSRLKLRQSSTREAMYIHPPTQRHTLHFLTKSICTESRVRKLVVTRHLACPWFILRLAFSHNRKFSPCESNGCALLQPYGVRLILEDHDRKNGAVQQLSTRWSLKKLLLSESRDALKSPRP